MQKSVPREVNFIFICQQGKLEAQAILLALSLRYFMGYQHKLIAACPLPEETYGKPSQLTLDILKSLEVEILPIHNPISESYPIGNKLGCLGLHKNDCGIAIFLDSDIVALRQSNLEEFLWSTNDGIYAVPSRDHHLNIDEWKFYYSLIELTLPTDEEIKAWKNSVKDKFEFTDALPYFNAGLVAASGDIAKEFSSTWVEVSQKIFESKAISRKVALVHLDQVSLPITAKLLNLDVNVLSRDWNYSGWGESFQRSPEGQYKLPIFYHYHHGDGIIFNKPAYEVVTEILDSHPDAKRAIAQDPSFNLLSWEAPYFLKQLRFQNKRLERKLFKLHSKRTEQQKKALR